MRTLATTIAILGTTLALGGCGAGQESPPPAAPSNAAAEPAPVTPATELDCALAGTGADQVVVHQAPATAAAPFTVKTTPAVPVFDRSAAPAGGLRFVRTPPKPTDRWERVAVANLRNASTGDALPASSVSESCAALTGPEAPEADRCTVTFPPDMPACTLFKYDILLYEKADDAAPALAIDPVGILK